MSDAFCTRAQDLRQSLASGVVAPELRTHAATCPACLTMWLTATAQAAPPLTLDPAALWERAGRMRRLRAEAQMSRILTGAQVAAAVLILAVLVFFGSQTAPWATFSMAGATRTWTSLSLAGVNPAQVAAGLAMLLLAAAGVSRLIVHDNG